MLSLYSAPLQFTYLAPRRDQTREQFRDKCSHRGFFLINWDKHSFHMLRSKDAEIHVPSQSTDNPIKFFTGIPVVS